MHMLVQTKSENVIYGHQAQKGDLASSPRPCNVGLESRYPSALDCGQAMLNSSLARHSLSMIDDHKRASYKRRIRRILPNMRRYIPRLGSVLISFCHGNGLKHQYLRRLSSVSHLSALEYVNLHGPGRKKEPRIVYLGSVEGQLSNRPDDDTNAPCPDRGGPGRRWQHRNFQAATVGVRHCACALLDVAGSCSGPRVCRVCLSEECSLCLNPNAQSVLATGAQL